MEFNSSDQEHAQQDIKVQTTKILKLETKNVKTENKSTNEKQNQDYSESQPIKVNKKGVALWTKKEKKLFLSFVVFYFDQMDIYPHKMTWGTFNFMSAYVLTKTKQQCRAFFQRRYKAQNSKLASMVNKMLIRKDDSKQSLQKALQQEKQYVLKRIQTLKNKSGTQIFRFVDQINDQKNNFTKIKNKIVLRIDFLHNKQ